MVKIKIIAFDKGITFVKAFVLGNRCEYKINVAYFLYSFYRLILRHAGLLMLNERSVYAN